jgi:L-rhamnose mutarotase
VPRFCYTFKLLPGTIALYEQAHAEIGPEVVAAMKRVGITDSSLFRRGHSIIAWGECERPVNETLSALDSEPANERWSKHIRTLMYDPLDDNGQLLISSEIWRML